MRALQHEFYGCCTSAITAAIAIELHLCCKNFASTVSLQVLVVITVTACMLLTIDLQVITATADKHALTIACMYYYAYVAATPFSDHFSCPNLLLLAHALVLLSLTSFYFHD